MSTWPKMMNHFLVTISQYIMIEISITIKYLMETSPQIIKDKANILIYL